MSKSLVRTLIHRQEVDSTSDVARELVDSAAIELPLLVRADRQTRGRGRGSNTWWSDAGSLTFTLALDPAAHGLSTAHEPRLALAAAVALVEAICRVAAVALETRPGAAAGFGIRWPNDVEAAGRKLAGILPERVETRFGVRLLVGIGLNVETRFEGAPSDVQRLATSLAALGVYTDPAQVLEAFIDLFAMILPRLARGDAALAARWEELDTLRGKTVHVDVGPRVIVGVARGIDPEGALLVATEQETLQLFGGRVLRVTPRD
jgi:BirA family biotin operon repressor/biotin-[acetyl-CoA-carboxylase] ligase